MGPYINRRTLLSFFGSVGNLASGKAHAVRCSKKKIKMRGLDLDKQDRALRIMAKYGYLRVLQEGGSVDYTLTPKGLALYDAMIISYSKPA